MKKPNAKVLTIMTVLALLTACLIIFATPNKLGSQIYLAVLKSDFETVVAYLGEHREISSIYYISPIDAQNGQSAFMLTTYDGDIRYSTGDMATDKSINKIVCSYQFNTIRAKENCVFFCLNKFSTHFSRTLQGIQYTPSDKPLTSIDELIKNERMENYWYYFVEQDEVLG